MKSKNLLKYFIVAATISIVFIACKKRETTPDPVDSDTSGSIDNALAEGTFNEAANIADQAAGGSLPSYLAGYSNGGGERTHCGHLSGYSNGTDTVIVILFGGSNPPSPCMCHDGKLRSGTITVTFSRSGHYYDIGKTISIAFANYTVNGNTISGSHKIYHKAVHTDSVYVNATITKVGGGGSITWVSDRTREWTTGFNTPTDPSDDVYTISGKASGTHSNGNGFNESAYNLKIHLNCKWIESGDLNIQPTGKPIRYIKFGQDGQCDSLAKVIINNIEYQFIMP